MKVKEAEVARETSRSKEFEIDNLKLQKDYQDLTYELDGLRQDFNGRDKRLTQLLDDRTHVEQIRQEAAQTEKINSELKREAHQLRKESINFNAQLGEEKCKTKDLEALLHENYEKQILVQDQLTSLQNQLQEERNARSSLAIQLQQEQESSARHDVRKLEDRNESLQREKKDLVEKVNKLEQAQHDLSKSMGYIEKDKSDSENKERLLIHKLKK